MPLRLRQARRKHHRNRNAQVVPTFPQDDQIAGCTNAIKWGKYAEKDKVWAYGSRGRAYQAKGELDRAIADYEEVIRLDPKLAIAYANR